MKSLYACISLLFILLFAGQHSFAANGIAFSSYSSGFSPQQNVTSASTRHKEILDVVVVDFEEETHNGNELKDTVKPFPLYILSTASLKAHKLDSIVALKRAPVHFSAPVRIPSTPIYITNRVLRL